MRLAFLVVLMFASSLLAQQPSVVITWSPQDGSAATVITIPADTMVALEAYRLSKTVPHTGGPSTPIYPSVQAMVAAGIQSMFVLPAINAAPPVAVQVAKAAVLAAQAQLQTAQATAVAATVNAITVK